MGTGMGIRGPLSVDARHGCAAQLPMSAMCVCMWHGAALCECPCEDKYCMTTCDSHFWMAVVLAECFGTEIKVYFEHGYKWAGFA